jgi:hypothetical protein
LARLMPACVRSNSATAAMTCIVIFAALAPTAAFAEGRRCLSSRLFLNLASRDPVDND